MEGFTPKNLVFDDAAREKLIAGISKISNAVKSTLGPMGDTVLIESPNHTRGITVTKDGVTVAKAVDLLDPVENLAVRMMKEASERTATLAGDGTTTAIVLTEAIIQNAIDLLTQQNKTKVLRLLQSETEKIIDALTRSSKPVNKRMLSSIATISANNDSYIGQIISDVYKAIGETGIVTVEKSSSSETTYETTHGIKVDRGYTSPMFINDQRKDECLFEETKVLVTDSEITNILQIENILKPIVSEGMRLLIIAPCASNVINTLAANVVKNGLKICNIQPPSFGYKQHELMQDIAVAVGATYFSEKTGDDLSLITFADLGTAERVIVGRDSTIIIKNNSTSEKVQERVKQLKEAKEGETKKTDRDFIDSRIASLTGGVGVISVGADTEIEQKEIYDRVDDAVCAVRSAIEDGILPGGGLALARIGEEYNQKAEGVERGTPERIAYFILSEALQAPLMQILRNAGLDYSEVYHDGYEVGYDVKNDTYGDMIKMGVIDPAKVTKNALRNAVSVATTILSTNAIITMARSYEGV